MNLPQTIEDEIKAIHPLLNIEVHSNEDNTKAAAILKGLRGLKDKIKETFRPSIEQAHGLWKGLLAKEKQYTEPIDKAEAIVKSKVLEFARKEEIKRAELERQKQFDAVESGEEIMPVIPSQVVKQEGVKIQKRWTFEITDEKLIPREYLCVDTVKIGGVVRSMKDGINIPGVRIYQEEVLAVSK